MRLQPVPFLQARKGALFFDSQKGLGYDIQSDNGLYLEHTLALANEARPFSNPSHKEAPQRME